MSKRIAALFLFVPAVYAAEPAGISSTPYDGDGKITVVSNEDGTWTTSVVVTEEGFYQEDCIIKMSHVTKEEPVPTFIGKACTRIRIALPGDL